MAELSFTSSSGLEPHTIPLKERYRLFVDLKFILRFSIIFMFQNVCFVVTTSETGKILISATSEQAAVFWFLACRQLCVLLKPLKMRLMWKILFRLSVKSIVLSCPTHLS